MQHSAGSSMNAAPLGHFSEFIIVLPLSSEILGLMTRLCSERLREYRLTDTFTKHIPTLKSIPLHWWFKFNLTISRKYPLPFTSPSRRQNTAHCRKGGCQGTKIDFVALVPRADAPRECACQGSFLPAKIIQFLAHENVSPHFVLTPCVESGAYKSRCTRLTLPYANS